VSLTVLAVLSILYTLYFSREFLLPIVFAVLLSFLLSPLVRGLVRFRIPAPVGAGLIVLAILGVLGSGAFGLSGAVRDWAAAVPATIATAEARLDKIIRPIRRASRTAEQVANVAGAVAGSSSGAAKPAEVVVQGPSLASGAFGTTQRLVASVLEVVILLYFLLAVGDLFLQKLIKVLPNLRDKRKAVQIARATESSISMYLLTTASVTGALAPSPPPSSFTRWYWAPPTSSVAMVVPAPAVI
jgi:predicted PurR-regulated permease PerM